MNDVNRSPVLHPISPQTISEGQAVSLSLIASDPDNDPLTYSISSFPYNSVLSSTGLFTWTPSFAESGPYTITFTVSDGLELDSKNFNITVNNVNRAPVLDNIGNKSVNENEWLTFTASGTDTDNDPLTFTASGLPIGATFNAITEIFNWTTSGDQIGNHSVTFNVSDLS